MTQHFVHLVLLTFAVLSGFLRGNAATAAPWFSRSLVGLEVGPAVLFNRLGKGAVLTFAASPDWATASDHHLTETRKLLANAVRLLHPEPRINRARVRQSVNL
jgi:hypothetical protein